MKSIFSTAFLTGICLSLAHSQCKIAFDNTDEFDSTRIIATQPMNLGFLVVSGNVPEDYEGEEYVEEAKAIFSYSDENNVRSFFLTLGVVERKFYMIGNDYNIMIKFVDGTIMRLFNVPADAEFDREILMWKYMHTCVVPLEIFHMMKNVKVEKIRINYQNYKSTIALEPKQQQALQDAVKCVGDRLANLPAEIKP